MPKGKPSLDCGFVEDLGIIDDKILILRMKNVDVDIDSIKRFMESLGDFVERTGLQVFTLPPWVERMHVIAEDYSVI